ncbi:hypothetical protein V1503_19140 [Bacillus sp. SCS-151]
MKKQKLWIEIEGSINEDVDCDTFTDEFIDWLESKGWEFAGVTKPLEDE